MGDSNSWKPGSRPGGNAPPAKTPAAREQTPTDPGDKVAGRVVHDERGNAVWDWIKDTTRIAIDSTSRLLKKLEVPELTMEDTQSHELRIESDRDAGGGYDPYGSSTSSRGTARGSETRAPAGRGTDWNTGSSPGGGYDPYGKGVTRKSTRKP